MTYHNTVDVSRCGSVMFPQKRCDLRVVSPAVAGVRRSTNDLLLPSSSSLKRLSEDEALARAFPPALLIVWSVCLR